MGVLACVRARSDQHRHERGLLLACEGAHQQDERSGASTERHAPAIWKGDEDGAETEEEAELTVARGDPGNRLHLRWVPREDEARQEATARRAPEAAREGSDGQATRAVDEKANGAVTHRIEPKEAAIQEVAGLVQRPVVEILAPRFEQQMPQPGPGRIEVSCRDPDPPEVVTKEADAQRQQQRQRRQSKEQQALPRMRGHGQLSHAAAHVQRTLLWIRDPHAKLESTAAIAHLDEKAVAAFDEARLDDVFVDFEAARHF